MIINYNNCINNDAKVDAFNETAKLFSFFLIQCKRL